MLMVITVVPAMAVDTLFDGTVTLTPGATFDTVSYSGTYTVSQTTPLGALHATGLTYKASDYKWSSCTPPYLMLDDIPPYIFYKNGGNGKWLAYVNEVYHDGWGPTGSSCDNAPLSLNNWQVNDGDKVEYYFILKTSTSYADPNNYTAVKADALAEVKTLVSTGTTTPAPEFPTTLLPATMIIGFLGVVLVIRRTREL